MADTDKEYKGKDQQVAALERILRQDKARNFPTLRSYLRKIISRQAIEVEYSPQLKFSLSPGEAWQIISAWGRGEEGNLPIAERGNYKSLATQLLIHIEVKIVGHTMEAGNAYYSMLERANTTEPKITNPTPLYQTYENAQNLRKTIFDGLNKKFLGQLTSELEKSKFLSRITDPRERSMVAAILAANSANLRQYDDFTPDKVVQAVAHRLEDGQVSALSHVAYSEAAEPDLQELVNINNIEISKRYNSDEEYLQDQSRLAKLTLLTPTLTDLDANILSLIPHASEKERSALITSIRRAIVSSAGGRQVDGKEILSQAFQEAKLSGSSDSLNSLIPLINEVQSSTRHNLIGLTPTTQDLKIIGTFSVSSSAGVAPTSPWITQRDLISLKNKLVGKSSLDTELDEINTSILSDIQSGNEIDTETFTRFIELKTLASQEQEFSRYQSYVNSGPIPYIQNVVSKFRSNVKSVSQPYETTANKVWKGIYEIDDFIHKPFKKVADYWEKIQEKATITYTRKNGTKISVPYLNLGNFIYTQWVNLQKDIALKVFVWAKKISLSGHWYSGAFRQVADFSRAFFKSDASWGGAFFNFTSRKWGNTVEWASQKAFKMPFKEVKATIGKSVLSFAMKVAPGLTTKVLAYAAELGISATGVGAAVLVAQVTWDLLKGAVTFVKEFLSNEEFRNKFLTWAPIAAVFSLGAITAFLSGIPTVVTAVALGITAFLGAAALSIGSMAALASLIVIPGIMIVSLLYNSFSTTIHLDSGPVQQFVANLLCGDESTTDSPPDSSDSTTATEETTTPIASGSISRGGVTGCADCLVNYLTACYGNSVTGAGVQTTGIGCLLAKAVAPDVAAIIERSATSFTYLQCVGFVQASIACAGGSLEGKNACNYTSGASGYNFVSGLSGAKPGDPIVFHSSGTCSDGAPGHIGIMKQDAGALICLYDANQQCNGCVSNNNCLPKTNVAGYLKKS